MTPAAASTAPVTDHNQKNENNTADVSKEDNAKSVAESSKP